MASREKVHPDCVNASNPYHECIEACLEKIAQRQGHKEKKKSGPLSLSFRKKKNTSDVHSTSPGSLSNGSLVKSVDNPSPRSPFSAKKVIDAYNSHSSSTSQPHSSESQSDGNSIVKDPESSDIVPAETVTSYAFGTLAKPKNGKMKNISSPVPEFKSANGIENFSRNSSDVGDSISVVSDSYVTVGRYNVRPYLSSTLQAILDKYGDIAANCCLESASLRSYHLECVCSIVQELHLTPVNQLSNGKVKEMLAVLKDVESAQIDVGWLRKVLNEHKDDIEASTECQTAEARKAECDREIEAARALVRSLEEELARREQAVGEMKMKIEGEKARVMDLEKKSSMLNDGLAIAKRKLEKFDGKPLLDGLF